MTGASPPPAVLGLAPVPHSFSTSRKPTPVTLYLDTETYSPTDLTKSGVYRYSEDPGFLVLMMAWTIDDGPVEVAIGHEEILDVPGLWSPRVEKVAHNAQFDRVCVSCIGPGRTYLNPLEWRDTAAAAASHGYPRKLEHLAATLGGELKDSAGTRLINLFCKPNKHGRRNLPEEYPEEWAQFVEYCRQDVIALVDVDRRLPRMTDKEQRIYLADQRINDRGIRVDTEMAGYAVEAAEDNRMVQELEISSLTGVRNPGSPAQMLAWLQSSGLKVNNLQAETIAELLTGDLTETQRRVLELRQELALVASKKYQAALNYVSADGRLRGGFKFFGAHTGRWTGSGPQLHNLPRAALESEAQAEAAILDLKMGEGADAHTLKALVRPMFTGPFVVADYASIEARVLAWFAGEEWALQAFRDGRDIYTETAERMGGLTRFQGKVAVLALGYNGGVNSLRAMGAEGSDEVLQMLVHQWRSANPSICGLWDQMQTAFRVGGSVGEHLNIEVDEDLRRIRLPSGRAITYHDCAFKWENDKYGRRRLQASFRDPMTRNRAGTYGGRLIENVTQAVARDVLAEALVRLEKRAYAVVAHVHDEILVEASADKLPDVIEAMTVTPKWGEGLPLDAEGFACMRYRKA